MDYPQLKSDLENAISLKALRNPHAALILSFLHQQFKQAQRVTVDYQFLVAALETTLETLNHETPNSFPLSAREYLDRWSKELRLLRIYHGRDDVLVADLTPDAERVIRWLEELRQRPFIGTESRFLSIFNTLNELVAESNDDPEQRLAYLRQQQADLQHEIDEIIATGRVTRLSSTQIRERFMQASENALRLLSDFAAVEQNFRELARVIQEATLQPDVQKGEVVGSILDADEGLENSDEGRSFRAFWQFLISPTQKDELTRLLRAVYTLPDLGDLRSSSALNGLTKRLLDAGHKIIDSNRLLAEQLRRMLDERVIAESQRVRQLCAEIKQMAFQHVSHPPENDQFLLIELTPDVNLIYDRPLWSAPQETRYDDHTPLLVAAEENGHLLDLLYNQFYIDQALLEYRISTLLEQCETITLEEVFAKYPAEKGIAEVLTYLRIAVQNVYHEINLNTIDHLEICLNDGETIIRLRVPHTRFNRRPIS